MMGMSFMARPPRPPVQADGHSGKVNTALGDAASGGRLEREGAI